MPSDPRPKTGRSKRQVNAVRRTQGPVEQVPTASMAGFTTRAAILGLVFCALVVSAAVPLREYLSQRGQIETAFARQQAAQAQVKKLQDELKQEQDPSYIEKSAIARLHYVLPGMTAYVVITPAPSAGPTGKAQAGVTATGPEAPWYSQVWGSVKAADHPATVPSPTPRP